MTRILVTGTAGLVGREVVEALSRAGAEVVPFDIRNTRPQDICQLESLKRVLRGCDGVIHLAAVSRVAWGESDPLLCDSVNVAGTYSLLRAIKAASPQPWLVFASSREVYGNPVAVPVREDASCAPVNRYGSSKLIGERLVMAAEAQGLRAAVVRLSNVYGNEHDHPDRAVPSLLWRSMQGKDLCLTGADVYFDFVHVEDCAKGLLMTARAIGPEGRRLPPIHLVTGVRTTLLELARLCNGVASSSSAIVTGPARRFDVSGFWGDPSRAEELLGFRTEVALENGLRRLRDILLNRGRAPDPFDLSELRLSRVHAG